MVKLFDDEMGFLRLDEIVLGMESFQSILADKVITDDEIITQANHVVELFRKIDSSLADQDKELVVNAVSELAVLYALNAIKGGR
jgi:hypothetical protein